jgi:hypothetical protein
LQRPDIGGERQKEECESFEPEARRPKNERTERYKHEKEQETGDTGQEPGARSQEPEGDPGIR